MLILIIGGFFYSLKSIHMPICGLLQTCSDWQKFESPDTFPAEVERRWEEDGHKQKQFATVYQGISNFSGLWNHGSGVVPLKMQSPVSEAADPVKGEGWGPEMGILNKHPK